jgi:hypothetical protein
VISRHSRFAVYLPSPAYYYSTIAKDLKRISAKFRPGQDSNQERTTNKIDTKKSYGSIDM